MCELSAADGFVKISENLEDMIKYVANEPSVGLYYIQQHAQNAVPNIIRLKNNVSEKSNEVSFHTEDMEDSIAMTRIMKQCGSPIIDEMIRDIKACLNSMSTEQPIRGVIQQRSSSYQIGGSSSWAPVTWARSAVSSPNDGEKASSYFSSVFNLKWPQGPQLDVKKPFLSTSNGSSQEYENDELPASRQVEEEAVNGGALSIDGKTQPIMLEEREFDEFKADKEARLEAWLEDSGSIL